MGVFTTSYLRSNIIAWLPVEKEDSVLFIKNGIPAIEEKLKEMSEHVTCILPEECKNIKDKFDYIINIGNPLKMPFPVPGQPVRGRIGQGQEYIKFLKELLTEKGKLILGIENKIGLKYLSGAKEEATHTYYAGLENNPRISGFSKKELETMLGKTGSRGKFYYPFPDYSFAMSIYSDEYQPKVGELADQVGNFDEERLLMFDESMGMNTLIEEGLFPQFSNSYLLVIENGEPAVKNRRQEEILFIKFSNDRGEERNIRTFITKSNDGRKHLYKMADSAAALSHIRSLGKASKELSELFSGTRFSVNGYTEREEGAEFQFLAGSSLEEEADILLEEGEEEKACNLLLGVAGEIRKCKGQRAFETSGEFENVFGRVNLPESLTAAPFCDIDMILPNIILAGEKKEWIIIDYEWSFDFPIPVNFVIYRMLHYYVDAGAGRSRLRHMDLYEKAGISPGELETYSLMEKKFQEYILAGHTPLRQLFLTEGKPRYHIERVLRGLNEIREIERRQALTIYFDRGAGFSEEDILLYRCEALDGVYSMEAEIPMDVKNLRIDPGNEAVTVDIRKLYWKGGPEGMIPFVSNGHKLGENQYLFDTKDPNILISPLPEKNRVLVIDLKVETMSLEAAEWIAPKIDTRYKIKRMLKK